MPPPTEIEVTGIAIRSAMQPAMPASQPASHPSLHRNNLHASATDSCAVEKCYKQERCESPAGELCGTTLSSPHAEQSSR